ncbi:hypothetical protein FO519_000259 [Halicephalobus sp. NKZ332]|nr:hypothetical protein FO519_000259 [Halicephalobus sp. NKZ332]
MKHFILGALFLVTLVAFCGHVEAMPSNSMTRIQEVLRTLMGSKPHLASRGKKFYRERVLFPRQDDYGTYF